MKKGINWLEILLGVIIILLFIMILSRIFGKSATDVQIYLAFFSGLLVIMGYTAKLNKGLGEIKMGIKYGFNRIKEDIRLIKGDINPIKKKLNI